MVPRYSIWIEVRPIRGDHSRSASWSNLKGCPLGGVKTPPPSISFWSLRSDLWSERSKTKGSLSFVTDATSLRGSLNGL